MQTKKNYYVDGHEKPEQRFHRYQFGKKYLQELEYNTHRWVHKTYDELMKLKRDGLVNKKFQDYNIDNSQLVELHVDEADILQEIANTSHPEFGR